MTQTITAETHSKGTAVADIHDVVIIGSGPAAWTAAIYAGRANLHPVVVASSVLTGGDLMNTTEVENFPGFPEGIQGPLLMERMQAQAERFGASVIYDDATQLDLIGPVKTTTLGSGEKLVSRTVIYATGSAYRKLGLAAEERLSGYGVSWCATCDGFFFRDQDIAVVGGGDSALEEALFLTKFARKVYLLVRGDRLRASQVMQDRTTKHPSIEILYNTSVVDILGENTVSGLVLNKSDEFSGQGILDVTGLFVAIGSDPRTHLVHGQLDITDAGTIQVDGRSTVTNVPGVFAAGDVIDPHYRQAIVAAALGATAAMDVEAYISSERAR